MTWFDELTGFSERTADDVRAGFQIDETRMTSLVNNRTFDAGQFDTPSLAELRRRSGELSDAPTRIRISELVGDVRQLHLDCNNENAVFQVASQFNCLEMVSPRVTPEDGVGIYENDLTQGPACSISAGAGTIFRNYFAPVNGRIGQSRDNQIDCLSDVGSVLGNDQKSLWKMQNGYCFPTATGLAHVEKHLAKCDETELDNVRTNLRVGVQSNTQVTIDHSLHKVTQVFCSALPISYSDIAATKWNHFPRLILDATYEATFHVAQQNLAETGCDKLFLTLVGGGVFGNRLEWILSAIARSVRLFSSTNLDVSVVSYGSSNREVASFLSQLGG